MKRKIKKIALICPRRKIDEQDPLHTLFETGNENLKLWYTPPLSLLIIASLTPREIEITVIDEYIEEIDFNIHYDLVGLTSMTQQSYRAYEIASVFKSKGIPVVMGGIHATVCPDEALQHVDTIFRGESERLWPRFINDFDNGTEQRIYMDTEPFDLSMSVVPRYDLLNYEKFKKETRYFKHLPLNATRGCPHDCSFCVVSKFYGKKIRRKPVAKIVEEIKEIQRLNYESSFLIVDDNLFCDRRYAKELLNALIPLKIKYYCQTDVKIADDPELLDLIYRSGCAFVLIGFESIDPESLKGLNGNSWKFKQLQNYENAIKIIQSHGLVIYGAFIIGFENDTLATFDSVKNFILRNKITGQFTLLTPLPGSKIYEEMKQDGRLINDVFWDKANFYNLVVKHDRLNKEEAEKKIIQVHEEVHSPHNEAIRCRHMMEIYKTLPPRWTN